MRTYILTQIEKNLLMEYLDNGTTSDAFYVLLNRITANRTNLLNELGLIQRVIDKRENSV